MRVLKALGCSALGVVMFAGAIFGGLYILLWVLKFIGDVQRWLGVRWW